MYVLASNCMGKRRESEIVYNNIKLGHIVVDVVSPHYIEILII